MLKLSVVLLNKVRKVPDCRMIFTPLKLVDPEVLQKPLQDHHWSIYS